MAKILDGSSPAPGLKDVRILNLDPIRRGLLRRSIGRCLPLRRRPGSVIEPDLHFLMAQAYGDIVHLAAGDEYGESGRAKYQPEAASARTRAIEQFRIAFGSANNTRQAREAWPDAWRLVAGLPPSKTHFLCFYD